jgi:ABC-type microcin C transport system duplicated ATPase subunit YejF
MHVNVKGFRLLCLLRCKKFTMIHQRHYSSLLNNVSLDGQQTSQLSCHGNMNTNVRRCTRDALRNSTVIHAQYNVIIMTSIPTNVAQQNTRC